MIDKTLGSLYTASFKTGRRARGGAVKLADHIDPARRGVCQTLLGEAAALIEQDAARIKRLDTLESDRLDSWQATVKARADLLALGLDGAADLLAREAETLDWRITSNPEALPARIQAVALLVEVVERTIDEPVALTEICRLVAAGLRAAGAPVSPDAIKKSMERQ